MNIAIVGAGHLTKNEEDFARNEISRILINAKNDHDELTIISGGATGIDSIAEDMANVMGINTTIFPAETFQWEDKAGKRGFKTRNLQIVNACDELNCFPAGLRDIKCYHCNRDHQVGGGCWTMWQARKLGKATKLILPPNI